MKYVWILILLFLLSSCVSTESLYRDNFQGEWLCDYLPMGDFVEFYDLDYMLGYKSLYGPNGKVKKTDVIIEGVHYTSEQQY